MPTQHLPDSSQYPSSPHLSPTADVDFPIFGDTASAEADRQGSPQDVSPNRDRFSHIPGWGADLAHANRPAYPKERMPARLQVDRSKPLLPQLQTIEVLHSTEREGLTPLFGTTLPPSGLSGGLRRLAYKLSENDLRHWLLLLLADRVNVVEGVVDDLQQGHIPNLFAEMGGRAEFRYNRGAAVRKVLLATALAGAGVYLFRQRRNRRLGGRAWA
jgi:hypothetical protein